MDPRSAEGGKPRVPDPMEASLLLTGEGSRDGRRLALLLQAVADVTSNLTLERVLDSIVDKSIALTRAERAILLLRDGKGLTIRVARDAQGRDLPAPVQYSTTVAGRVVETGEAIRSMVGGRGEKLDLGQTVIDLRLRAVMCVPLRLRERTLGAVYVDSRASEREFSKSDLAFFDALGVQIAVALENARLHADSLEKERMKAALRLAADIQRRLLPTVPPEIPGLDLQGAFLPAEETTADSFDFVPLPGGRVALVVGDATGHGIGPALVMATVRASLRAYFRLLDEPGEVVTRLNADLRRDLEEGMFFTAFLAVVDPGRGELRYVNAGHPPALLRRAEGAVEALGKTGAALGLLDEEVYDAAGPIPLRAGDLLLAFTDGIVEARSPSGELFGDERLVESLARSDPGSARALLDRVLAGVREFSGGLLEDDVTLIAARVQPR
ncbi:MAG TPA: GAF domain-containing SpoIIE family protein phosphatase [Planctomycetota bacterium]|nr:GAF domain-containing SpoIIE family protein phosphatase [Planctomycetota bacterium]